MHEMTFIIGPDRPVASVWDALGAADINLEASCTYPSADGRIVRIVLAPEHAAAGRAALAGAGFGAIDSTEVMITDIDNRAGQLGELARKVADAGASLTTLYMAMGDRAVVGADDLAKIREVLAG
ncbi:MAG: hypothetical protein GY953_43130 [bacterium]|nr:hypothetical protein [bacterium]